ncbi:hypothetical protein HXX76_013972 [Chlamydomonas incerta]|uniref:Uncharacterized protein n=1 Tax=Chlamydomonas incerta TaxID=51695 RepID=A0A835SD33_CHLIN|nr:hypothetical protein HXX76_013972 [Chlamydomonas incerta]|eukprot:KAG2425063.1 hypothetical protein HXX76_013972 [Chlamydomonas incerta]
MAAAAEGDDVCYSHTLTKLFRVNVERASSDAQARQRALSRATSAHTGREPSAFAGGLQVRGAAFASLGSTSTLGGGPGPAGGVSSSMALRGTASNYQQPSQQQTQKQQPHQQQQRRGSVASNYNHQPPSYANIPASFMRSPRSAPTTPRQRPHSSPVRRSGGSPAGPDSQVTAAACTASATAGPASPRIRSARPSVSSAWGPGSASGWAVLAAFDAATATAERPGGGGSSIGGGPPLSARSRRVTSASVVRPQSCSAGAGGGGAGSAVATEQQLQLLQLQQQRYLAAAVALGLDGHITATVVRGGAAGATCTAETAPSVAAADAATAEAAAATATAARAPNSPRMSSLSVSSSGGGVYMAGGAGAGHSNLSYRPAANPAAEPAAAAAARLGRLVASIGSRHGAAVGGSVGVGSAGGSPRASTRVSGVLLSSRSPRVHEHMHHQQQHHHHQTHQAFAHLPLGVAEPAPWAPAGGDAEDTEAGEAGSDLGSQEVTASGGIAPAGAGYAGGGGSAFAGGSGALAAAAAAAASARSRSASISIPAESSPRPMTAPAGPGASSPGRGRAEVGSPRRSGVGSPPGGGLGATPPSPFAPPQQLYLVAKKEEEAAAAAAAAAARAANSPFAAAGSGRLGGAGNSSRQSQLLAGLSSSSLVPRLDFSRLRINGSQEATGGGFGGGDQISGVISYDPDAAGLYGCADGTAGPRGSLALGSPSVRQLKWAADHEDGQGEGEGAGAGEAGEGEAGARGSSQRRQGSGVGTDDSGTDGEGASPRSARLGSPSSRALLASSPSVRGGLGRSRSFRTVGEAGAPDAAAAAAADDQEPDSPLRRLLRSGTLGYGAAMAEPSAANLAAAGPRATGETNKTLQVGISVAVLVDLVKRLGPSQRHASTAEVWTRWLEPPTRSDRCRFLDLVMEMEDIVLGEPPPGAASSAAASLAAAATAGGRPVLKPERTWWGQPDHYVIHAWSGNFAALVAALREFCALTNKGTAATYVWLDVMAVNHHPGGRDKKELARCREVLARGKRALLVVDAAADVFARLWPCYETWLAGQATTGAAAGGGPSTGLTLLNAGCDWDTAFDAFFRIDMARAATRYPEDRAKLVEDMVKAVRGAGESGSSRGGSSSNQAIAAALPQVSAEVRGAVAEAAAADLGEARQGARGTAGMLALLDAVERYAMIRRIAGGHPEAEEQLAAAVAAAIRASGGAAALSGPAGGGGGGKAAASSAVARIMQVAAAAAAAAGSGGGGGGGDEEDDDLIGGSGGGQSTGRDADHHAAPLPVAPPLLPLSPAGGAGAVGGGKAGAAAAGAGGGGTSSSAVWRRKPATLAALAWLQVEHGKLVPAMTHAAMALSCVHGLSLVRPQEQPDHEHEYEQDSRGGKKPHNSSSGAARDAKAGKHDPGAKPLHPPPIAPGVVAWRGAHWELANAAAVGPGAARAMLMVAGVEAAVGRPEAAAQLALAAAQARSASLGHAHPATLVVKRVAVTYLLKADRVADAQLLAQAMLREAMAAHGEAHPLVGAAHGAAAEVLAAQNRPEQAYASAQRAAEVAAAALGRAHPATLDALQLCVDVLESAQEYSKAVALMRLVVEGRGAPGALRASPSSPGFLLPNARLLHLRSTVMLEEKAAAEENPKLGRLGLAGLLRDMAKLEAELKAALLAVGNAVPLVKKDLEMILLAQNKRYEAALLLKGELPLTRQQAEEAAAARSGTAAASGGAGGGRGAAGAGGRGGGRIAAAGTPRGGARSAR